MRGSNSKVTPIFSNTEIEKQEKEGRLKANLYLQQMWIKEDKIIIPVDTFLMCRNLGIKVYETDFPDYFLARLQKKRGYYDPEILLNKDKDRSMQRAALAYLLAIYSKKVEVADDGVWNKLLTSMDLFATAESSQSIFAQAFMQELLLPRKAFINGNYNLKPSFKTEEDFNVPRQLLLKALN